MRILIVGAGALGGYVGARLLAAHKDVTFLVREQRAARLEQTGLKLESPLGNFAISPVPYVTENTIRTPYDLVVVACKAYDLSDALMSFAPAVSIGTAILPLLNGVLHLKDIAQVFGVGHLLGGQCTLAATLSPEGYVRHLNDSHALTLGELDGTPSPRVNTLEKLFGDAGFQHVASGQIQLEMWEKFVFIAAAMSFTVLTRIMAKPPRETVDTKLVRTILTECNTIAVSAGFVLRPIALARARMILEAPNSILINLMFEHLHHQPSTEANHILGDLMQRAQQFSLASPRLEEAYHALRTRDDSARQRTENC